MATSNADDAASVLDAVRDLVPTLRDNGAEAENRRWIPDENVQLLEKARVFQVAVPRRFGGLDLPVADQAEIMSEVARGCGSTGWVVSAWTSSTWMGALYPEQAQEEIFAGGSVRISGAFTATGKLTPTDGGYLLNGSWRFNTGCRAANWNIHAAILDRADGEHEELYAIVPISELSIADDWFVSSASGTGSFTTTATDVFVPRHRVLDGVEALDGTAGSRSGLDATHRNYALVPYVAAVAMPVYLGLAQGALELFIERLPGRGIAYSNWTDQSQHPFTHIQVATAANKITAARAMSREWLGLLQARADSGEQLTIADRAVTRGQIGYAIQLAKEAVDILYSLSGASVIARSVPLQRIHRDIQGLALHGLMAPVTSMEAHGRILLGLDPDTVYL